MLKPDLVFFFFLACLSLSLSGVGCKHLYLVQVQVSSKYKKFFVPPPPSLLNNFVYPNEIRKKKILYIFNTASTYDVNVMEEGDN